jgi:hypothetical protein
VQVPLHVAPQAPQLLSSVRKFEHPPLQAV